MHITSYVTVVILVSKIIEIKAGCYWNTGNPGTECLMYCINENTTEAIKIIERLYGDDGVMFRTFFFKLKTCM